ncbi:DUF262 domain-containing protein [Pedobacter miscanthi]|uniref:DUF262 domain-containing protein n=1 Tax=Pedobacter miscanthi TaxID=2259170 RepID=A0A366L006_9SPHI|nr:DUF262 domain-containing protein [Pedobacter miscanthi]RBQ06819.1 DUF262 domain-containing protein [Pedobacter miscanthi]
MNEEETKNVVHIPAEQDDDYSNDDLFNITSWGADLSFRELITMYEEGELLKPELQRKYVWDKTEASRFIDSILLGLPVPSIFLAKEPNDNKLIIDGYQRIMTVYDFVKGIFSTDGKVFKLSNTKRINERWRGKAYIELNDNDQKKIRSTTIHAIIFQQKKPIDNDTSLYQIFERINTSGRTLKPQEIRNCVYQGKFNTLLFTLNSDPIWRKLYGLDTDDPRMEDLEFILRLFALSSEEIKKKESGQISLKKFLNEYMGSKESENEKVLEKRESTFTKVISLANTIWGEQAFHNISQKDGKLINKFHPTIFDSIGIALINAINQKIDVTKISDLPTKRINLLKDEDYKAFTSTRTTNVENIKGRINKASEILFGIKYE